MATLAHVRAAASKLGATVQDERIGGTHSCRVEAPHGTVWKGHALHEFVDSVYQPWKPDYADLLDRMRSGVEPCPAGPDCEWCHPQDD